MTTGAVAAALARVSAVGVESTAGTAVTPTKRFASFGLTKSPQYTVGRVRPAGLYYPTKHILSGEHTELSVEEGVLSYDESIYPLAGVCQHSVAAVANGTTSQEWTFTTDPYAADDLQTYTVESGIIGGRGGQGAYGAWTEWGFTIARNAETSEMSGSMISRAIEAGALTDLSVEEFEPIVPSQVNLYVDDSYASIGSTKIDTAFSVSFTFGDRQSPVWFLNRAQGSYAGTKQAEPSTELHLIVADEANPVDDILLGLRNGDRRYIRIEAIGPEIEMSTDTTPVPINYSFIADFAAQVSDSPDEGDSDDAASVDLTFECETNPDLGGPFQIQAINTVSAL